MSGNQLQGLDKVLGTLQHLRFLSHLNMKVGGWWEGGPAAAYAAAHLAGRVLVAACCFPRRCYLPSLQTELPPAAPQHCY